MIHALVGFPIRGAIWYQGESNQTEGMQYYQKMKALIEGWRQLWGLGNFPFYYVQIAPFKYGNADPGTLAELWEAQAAALELPSTGMVVINDIATLHDIHPPDKQDVGLRLANLALKNDYGREDIVASSPEFESLEIRDAGIVLTFRRTGGGLKTRDGLPPSHFEIIGPGSNGFQPADAVLDGNTVTLRSNQVKKPTAFRFAWHQLALPNLMGGTGLPVGAVRGGEVPSFAQMVPGLDEWQLAYDLDLKNLGSDPVTYSEDRSAELKSFDRIGYLLELDGPNGMRNVFVSVNAFTDDPRKIGIPAASTGATFQQAVQSMTVISDADGVVTGSNIETGNIEFWSTNYGAGNSGKVPSASGTVYDFGDERSGGPNGYGSMQIHNHGAKQTIFAINNWRQGRNADIGIGNSSGNTRDWTFSGNAGSYRSKRLRIYVRPTP